jgi:hypothetical protein
MSKKFKRQKDDSNMFHHGLIKLIIVYHLSLHGDSWKAFIVHNGFEDTYPVQVDKPVVIETKAKPPVPLHLLLPKPSAHPGGDLPDTITKSAEDIKKPMRKNPRQAFLLIPKGKGMPASFREWPETNRNPLPSPTL